MASLNTQPTPDTAAPIAAKPGSATCCHALSVLSALGAVVCFFFTISHEGSPSGIYATVGCLAGMVLWWALGDIVASVNRIATAGAPRP